MPTGVVDDNIGPRVRAAALTEVIAFFHIDGPRKEAVDRGPIVSAGTEGLLGDRVVAVVVVVLNYDSIILMPARIDQQGDPKNDRHEAIVDWTVAIVP